MAPASGASSPDARRTACGECTRVSAALAIALRCQHEVGVAGQVQLSVLATSPRSWHAIWLDKLPLINLCLLIARIGGAEMASLRSSARRWLVRATGPALGFVVAAA